MGTPFFFPFNRHLSILYLAILCSVTNISHAEPVNHATLAMGIFPHLPPREIEQIFSPMAADIGEAVNATVSLRTSTTYTKFMNNLDQQDFDIAFVQPFDYVHIADKYGYLPLATRTEKLSAILVTKDESPIKNISDLAGKQVSLPPKVSAVSHLLKSHFVKNGLVPGKDVSLSHYRSHVSCMQQLLIGKADACGTAKPAMRFFEHRMSVKLKIVGESMKIPHTLFVIHPRIAAPQREQIQQRILNWSNTDKGKAILARGRLQPFVPINDSDYNVVRELRKDSL